MTMAPDFISAIREAYEARVAKSEHPVEVARRRQAWQRAFEGKGRYD
ncbi:MAG: hypothetical protein AB1730_20335 [Myxococcota bacterium]